jgi:hypothetical protein
MTKNRNAYGVIGFWCGKVKERDHLEHLGIDRGIIQWILKKKKIRGGGGQLDSSGS